MSKNENTSTRLTIVYLGTRGGGVFDTFALVKALSSLNAFEINLIISERNPLLSQFLLLPGISLNMVDTNLPTIKSLVLYSFGMKWLSIIRVVRRYKPSLVFVPMIHPWLVILPIYIKMFLPGTKLIYVRHNPPLFENIASKFDFILQKLDDYMTKSSTIVFTFSDFVRKEVLKSGIVSPSAITTNIGFGLHQSFKAISPSWRHRGFSTSGPLRVLFFGRILPYKGLDVLEEAMKLLNTRSCDIELTIAGEGKSTALESLCTQKNVRIFNRWIDDNELLEILADTDVVVAPYLRASQSGPVNIAVTMGIPLIVSDAGGLPELVKNEVTGYVIPAGSSYALAEALFKLAQSRELLPNLSRETIVFAMEELSWENCGKKILSTLESIKGARKI